MNIVLFTSNSADDLGSVLMPYSAGANILYYHMGFQLYLQLYSITQLIDITIPLTVIHAYLNEFV